MRLPETARHILAGTLSALGFLTMYFGLVLVWWAAFLGALLIYGATLLIVRKKPTLAETMVTARVSQADLQAAGELMASAAQRLETAQASIPEHEHLMIGEIIQHVRSIREQVLSDPEDYRRARRFISSYLGKMVDTVERYADLSQKSRGRHAHRLAALSEQIHSYVPVLTKIDEACLENDFLALESQVVALAAQLKRG